MKVGNRYIDLENCNGQKQIEFGSFQATFKLFKIIALQCLSLINLMNYKNSGKRLKLF